MPAYQEVDALPNYLGQAAGNFGHGFSKRTLENQRNQKEANAASDIFSSIKPEDGDEDIIKSIFSNPDISRDSAKTIADLVVRSRATAEKRKNKDQVISEGRRLGLQDTFNRMSQILSSGDSLGIVPGILPKAREERAEFDTLAAAFEAALIPLVSKGALAKPRFDYLMSLLPKSNNTDAKNRGLLRALAREFDLDVASLEEKFMPKTRKQQDAEASQPTTNKKKSLSEIFGTQ